MIRQSGAFLGTLLAASLALGAPASADSLADIRSELSQLAAQLQGLKSELTGNGASLQAAGGTNALDRMNTMEAELSRLTAQSEELQNRINRVVSDGTNRIGDLEFRLCELEDGCDVGNLPITQSLGGAQSGAAVPAAAPAAAASASSGKPELALSEKADFDRAKAVLDQGDFRGAADKFASFTQTYPGSPLTADAEYFQGQALASLGQTTGAANAYLRGFDAAKAGERAPDNLLGLGRELGKLGQVSDACVTLNEVGVRFPASPAAAQSRSAMAELSCR